MDRAPVERPPLERWTLRFPPAWEDAFGAEYFAASLRPLRTILVTIALLTGAYFAALRATSPQLVEPPTVWAPMLAVPTFATLALAASFTASFARKAPYVVGGLMLLIGAAIITYVYGERHASSTPFIANMAMMLLVAFGASFSRLGFARAALVTSAIVGAWVLFALVAGIGAELRLLFFPVAAWALALVAARSAETHLRNSFISSRLLDRERDRSERLLLNVLPGPIAARLKAGEEPIADGHREATILFADIVGFTDISTRCSPDKMITVLNDVFTAFDDLAARHGLEKIKTIGDAYMVAGGLPTPRRDHAEAVAEMALDMLEVLRGRVAPTGDPLLVRIGINTGPVVAGVIGRAKFAYDLWGDAVNMSSRMESHGVPGAVQVTGSTYERLKERYRFEERGLVDLKGKGPTPTYLLVDRREQVAVAVPGT